MVWWMMAAQANPFLAGFSDSGADAPKPVDKALASQSRQGLQASCMYSPVDGFYQFSDNWMHVTGQLPEDSMEQNWLDCWHPQLRRVFRQAVADLFSPAPEDRTDAMSVEGDVMSGDGQWRTLELALSVVGYGGAQKLSVLVCDATEYRSAQKQIAMAKLESRALEHCRASFLANMSHELRTPLNAIMGFAQMLELQQIPDAACTKDYLKHIRLSGEELLLKISDLIEMANIEAGRGELHSEPHNLSDLVSAAIEMQSHHAFEKGVTLHKETSCPQLVAKVDRSRLLHCLTHLLAEAIDRSHIGGQVVVALEANQKEGITLSVEDFGGGMSQRRLQNIRNSLRLSQSYYQTDIEDVSIAMAVCREILDLHGGALSIDSLMGRGTIAAMQLPASCMVKAAAKTARKAKQYG